MPEKPKSVGPGRDKKIFRWLCTCLVVAFCLWLVLFLMGRVLRRIAIGQIVELTNAKVETKSVDVDLDGSVLIEELVVTPHRKQKHDDAILKAKTVYARFWVGSVLLLQPRLREIRVKDFVFNAQHDLDTGRWNVAALKIKAPKGGCGKMPVICLEEGTLKYSKASNGRVKTIAAVPIEARFGPDEETQGGYSFNITTAKQVGGFGKSTLTGLRTPGRVTISGGVSSADIPAFEKVWMIYIVAAELNYDQSDNYSLNLVVKDLRTKHKPAGDASTPSTPEFLKRFGSFAALQKFFNRYDPRGRVDIDLKASGNFSRLSESKLAGKVYCRDVSICDRKFPYPVKRIVGQIDFTEKSAELKNLCGEHDDVKVSFSGWSKDFGPKRRYDIKVTSNNMALDDDLYDVLSPEQKRFWSAFAPSGVAAIDYHIIRQSETDKRKTLSVDLLGTEAVYRRFPYPLKNLVGNLLFNRDNITFSGVVSEFEGRKITINGEATGYNTDQPGYEFGISAGNIPLDSTLAACLSDRQKGLYDRLNLAGLADAEIKISTSKDARGPADVTADVFLKEASLKPDDFPLAASGVSAKTIVTRDLIQIESLSGNCGQGTVSLTGRVWPGAEAGEFCYRLMLSTKQVQLNDDLFDLLPESLKKTVSALHPKGKINYQADLNKSAGADQPDYRITVDCLGNSFDFEPFPYPLENITGSLTITTENIRPGGITAANSVWLTPATTTVKIAGRMAQGDDDVNGGRFDLDLENIRIFGIEEGKEYIDFAGVARFKGCSLNIRPAITELDAVLKIKGLYKTGEGFDRGEAILFADGLKIKGKLLTGLKADVYYDQGRQSWLTKNLVADCYGGKVAGKLEFKRRIDKTLEYLLQVGFDNINLKQFLGDRTLFCGDAERDKAHLDNLSGAEIEETSKYIGTVGEMSGSLSITGQMNGDGHSRIGRCRLTIIDMQVGKLSPLAKLLCVLKLTEPKDFAFDQMSVDSYIKHNRVFLEHLDLSGETVAFNGSGWIDLQEQILDLVLFGRGKRLAMAEPSVFQSLTESIGSAIVRIEVTGDFCEPKITTTTLSVIKKTLGVFGAKPILPDR